MKKVILKSMLFTGLIFMTLCCSIPAWAEDDTVDVSADVSVLSRYVWRGYTLSKTSAVVQPSLTFAYKGLSLNFWGNLDTHVWHFDPDRSRDTEYNETDITLSYSWKFNNFIAELGYIYYDLKIIKDTSEVYYSISYDTILSPSLTIYYDINQVEGVYANFAVSHSIPLYNDIALDLSASVGYYAANNLYEFNDNLVETTKEYSALHDGNITASVTFPINSKLSVTPSASYSYALSNKSRNHLEGVNGANFDDIKRGHYYGGITCSYTF